MAGRERDRERDRRAQAASARTNEYFVPKDGIDREVITADICRYLGNDALVRPGNYENPQTRQIQTGYFITAYRNLTTAMIADLKADSERWEAERRATASRGQPSNVEYRASTTHQSRQYYGPTEATPGGGQIGYPAAASAQTPQVYDSSQGAYQQQTYSQPGSGYVQPQGYAQDNNYYVAGADMAVDPRGSSARIPVTQAGVPRSNIQYSSSNSAYPAQPRDQTMYYSSQQPGVTVTSGYPAQPQDPYYGRAVPVTGPYESQDPYDSRVYQDSSTYGQVPVSAAQPQAAPATSNSSSRREREPERERDRHRHSRR